MFTIAHREYGNQLLISPYIRHKVTTHGHHRLTENQTVNNMKVFIIALIASIGVVSAWNKQCPRYLVRGVIDTAKDGDGLKPVVDKFRLLLGENNGNLKGPISEGRRQINWDAGIPFILPGDFFNRVVTRGIEFFTKYNLFAVSNPAIEPIDDVKFSSFNPKAAKNFITFSSPRLFTPVLDNELYIKFFVPGTKSPATVSGFGAVYTDVVLRGESYLELFDRNKCLIAKIYVPPSKKGLSFVGIQAVEALFPGSSTYVPVKAAVYKVAIKLGTAPIANYSTRHHLPYCKHHNYKYGYNHTYPEYDIVVLDDFIFGEPQKLEL